MLKPVVWREGDRFLRVGDLIHNSSRLPGVFRVRMKQFEAIHRWLGAYFDAVAIMLQIPGGAEYQWLQEDGDHAGDFIWTADRDMLFSILAEALDRLDAAPLIHQVAGARTYKRRTLPVELRLMLAGRDRNGMLNVVAECLDRLVVIPNLDEEERSRYESTDPRPRGWRRCWRGPLGCLSMLIRRR